jgi:hypothetical protein
MDRSRKLGWHGFVDTREAMFESLTELCRLGMIPAMFEKSGRGMEYVGY